MVWISKYLNNAHSYMDIRTISTNIIAQKGILPLFLFTLRSGFSQSQTLQSLTKYFEKSTNIQNIILASLESSSNVLSYYMNLVL
jgi:hypothetical protein